MPIEPGGRLDVTSYRVIANRLNVMSRSSVRYDTTAMCNFFYLIHNFTNIFLLKVYS